MRHSFSIILFITIYIYLIILVYTYVVIFHFILYFFVNIYYLLIYLSLLTIYCPQSPFPLPLTHFFPSFHILSSGARLGPRAIRQASVQLAELKPYPWGFDPFDNLAVIDYGDAMLDPHNPSTIRQSIKDHASRIINAKPSSNYTGTDTTPPKLLSFGGDHFVTYPLLQAHAEHYDAPISLIHFDAHCDTWPMSDKNELNHGTMFRHAVVEGIVDPTASVQIGIRTWNDDFMDFNILGADWVHENGVKAVVEKIESIIPKDRPVYLTFDIDCLDPAFAPGTGTPVPGGLTSAQALYIIRAIAKLNLNVIGADVVEVAPSYDISEVTALSAAHIATDILCMWSLQKQQQAEEKK